MKKEGQLVDFNTQIRPILNQKCVSCHGGVKQLGGISFVTQAQALQKGESGTYAITPGQPEKSELIKRIEHTDLELRMPYEKDALNKDEIALLKKWIKQGANWDTHWAYIAPQPSLPKIKSSWANNEIDLFVLQNLKTKGWKPSSPADKATLLRRISLDLTGLPPSPEEVRAFIEDDSNEAVETVIDRLLKSPHFGERWASLWLDLARYADSKGYQKDNIRKAIWRYRDWVIQAFNEDMPFDEFTRLQLAGDLLPNPNSNQLLATAFHRNTMTNDEGGTDDEEFRVAAVIDRVNTTMEIWQATTISCVQCHDHPYDPIEQERFYELYAFFNNSADHDAYDDRPQVNLYSPFQLEAKASLKSQMEDLIEQGIDTASQAYQNILKEFLSIQAAPIPVMQELEPNQARKSYLFERGNWLVHGQEIQAKTPDHFQDFDPKVAADRLGLAEWLVDSSNPLTGRVMVNRFWEQLFGYGLVTTLEDFGTQGETPVQQELLDWLAYAFANDMNWSIKKLLKTMVLSATYQQSSMINPKQLEADPENLYLSRGPRFRLSAEQIRDQALAVSGLLNTEIGGPSVMPYQPDGVWNIIRHTARWEKSKDGNQHRRALYTFWRRVSPYPSMLTFDAPTRELCSSRRIRTNTPTQALTTLNDPVFVEAAQGLAQRMITEGGSYPNEQIAYGLELALMRAADLDRVQQLKDLYQKALIEYDTNLPRQQPKQKAMELVANAILNLSEFITKT
ncbi:MAG: PSD1 and planctomycete cytochrome C domain-containing protein [Bacteroidota bacterium]